jgi:hypothetical protein
VRRTLTLIALAAAGLAVLAAPGGSAAAAALRARDLLPDEGLISSSVTALRGPKDLDAHYYLADETVLGLGRRTDAVLARCRVGSGEALVVVAIYPSDREAGRIYERFGRDFFSGAFDPAGPRFVERIETGDWAGAARRGRALIVVLESPDRTSCDALVGGAEAKASAALSR